MKEKATTGKGEYRKFYSCNSINVTQSFTHVYSIKFLFEAAENYLRKKNSGSNMLEEWKVTLFRSVNESGRAEVVGFFWSY